MRARKQHIWLSTYHVDNFRKGGCEKIKFKTSFFTTPQIHTFLAEGDTKILLTDFMFSKFQSTPSSRKVTCWANQGHLPYKISIHTFLAEGDRNKPRPHRIRLNHFNPHIPCGRWLCRDRLRFLNQDLFQSTPSSWKVTYQIACKVCRNKFQSTPFSRKVTHIFGQLLFFIIDFNPHLPRGRWLVLGEVSPGQTVISIHTFLAEGDWPHFQLAVLHHSISIHTFLAEGD